MITPLRLCATVLLIFVSVTVWGQSIWTNPITGTNPSSTNPYTTGQTVDANLSVTGIGRNGVTAASANDRYNTSGWNTTSIATGSYFTFTLTPNSGYVINFVSLVYTGQASGTGPTSFAVRSSLDSYTANIGSPVAGSNTISLSGASYQGVSTAITFRIYCWGTTNAGGTYSINDFTFNGTVALSGCTQPTTQATAPTINNATTSSLDLNFTRGNGNAVMIVRRAGSAATDPTAGTTYNVGDAVGGGTVAYKGTASGASTATSQTLGSLSAETQYFFNLYEYNNTGVCYKTPPATASAWTLSTEPGSHGAFTNCNATSYNQIDLTFQSVTAAGITNADGYIILRKAGSAPTGLPVDGTAYSAGNTIGDATVAAIVNSTSATTQSVTGLNGNTDYYFTLIPFNWNGANAPTYNYRTAATIPGTNCTTLIAPSSTSDVVDAADAAVYTSNIDYTQWQSATISNTSNSIAVFKFTLRDGGSSAPDGDALPTIMTGATFTYTGTANTVRAAALFSGNTFVASGTVGANGITFTGLSGTNVTAADDATQNLTLRVTFTTTVTDRQKLIFAITGATAAPSTSSSQFATVSAQSDNNSGNDRNRIAVTADRLRFVQQPSTTSVNVSMTPAVTVESVDANGNRDLDFTGSVSITSTGTLNGSPVSASATNGLATFGSLVHSANGTGFVLNAAGTGLTGDVSGTFDITTVASGSYRTTSDGKWPGGTPAATWERFNGTSWTPATPAANVTDMLFVRHNVTSQAAFAASGGVGTKMTVESGGTFSDGHNSTFNTLQINTGGTFIITDPAVDILAGTGTVTVESGGKITSNSATFNNFDGFWQGTENFKAGSTFEILNWDWDNSSDGERLIDTDNPVSTNANGYYFGNIVINGTPTGKAFTLVGVTGTQKLCENDLTVTNGSASLNVVLTSVNAAVEIGGNVVINQNVFSFGSITAFNLTHTVKGNIVGNGGIMDIDQTSSGSASVTVNLEGHLIYNDGTMRCTDPAGSSLVFTGSTLQNIDVENDVAMNNMTMKVANGANTQLIDQSLLLGNTSSFTVQNGGKLNFNFDGSNNAFHMAEITSGNTTTFAVEAGGTIQISSPQGIDKDAADLIGNVRTDTRTYDGAAIYHYIGRANQLSGDGLPATLTGKIIVELDTDVLTLGINTGSSRTVTAPGLIDIRRGILLENATSNFLTGTGLLTMTGGTYQISSVGSSLDFPRVTGTYTLTGGTVELNGTTDNATNLQTLRGGRVYHQVKISGSSAGGGYKTVGSAITLNQNLQITNSNNIFDIASKGVSGNAGITMDNGLFRISKLSTTVPELDGVSTPYSLTGGTIEFYGSNSSGSGQVIRSTYNGNPVHYNNVEVNAAGGNTNANNASPATPGFYVDGTLNVNSPAVFQLDVSDIILGTGTFNVNAGSTLKYAHADGIAASGTTGAVRTATRSFPVTASYGFVGNANQNVGSGLPAQMVNMYVQKDNTANTVTLAGNTAVNTALTMTAGNVVTGANVLELGISTAQTGTLNYTDGYVIGQMKRWFNGTNSGSTTGLFPIGVNGNDRFATVEYGNAPSTGGSLTTRFVGTAMGLNGLPLPIAAAGSCAAFTCETTSSEGYWQMDNGDGLAGGNYDITLVGENLTGITSLCELTALKRSGGGPWTQNGTHEQPTGSPARPTVKRSGASGWSNWGFGGGTVNPLPVTLTSFTGECDDAQNITLHWTTASEINSARFVVERSTDLQTYETVAETPAAGNSNEVRQYETAVHRSAPVSYYRLRQEDFDGAFEYYGPISINCQAATDLQAFVYNNVITVTGNNAGEAYTLTLTDMNGKQLYTENVNAANKTVDVSTYMPGVYLVVLRSQKVVKTFKIITH